MSKQFSGISIRSPSINDSKMAWDCSPKPFCKKQRLELQSQAFFQGEIIYAPPPPSPPFLAKRHFPVEGGGGVYFEAPRGRNFYTPPPFIHPPPLEGYFQGWGGGGV